MRALRLATGLAAVTLMASQSFAGGLFAPFSIDSTATMPKGIRSVRLSGFTTEAFDKYDGFGSIVPSANSFNKPVTWRELIDSQPAGFDRGQLKGGLESMGINLDSAAGDARGIVNARLTTTVPVLAYGITDNVTLGVGLPIMYTNVNVDTGWIANDQFNADLNRLMAEGQEAKVQAFKPKLQNVVATKIAGYGYKPLENETRTEIGDLNLGLKMRLYQGEKLAFALAPKLVVPTGRPADVDKVVDIASGDGQWDAGLGAIVDYFAAPKWTLTGSAGYTHQFETMKEKRIPRTGEESISPDKDTVREQLGAVMNTALGAKYKATNVFTLGAAYSLQYKTEDEYNGSRYAAARYGYLEEDTFQNLQAGQVSVSASTIDLYRKGDFPIPADIGFALSRVFDGRNVTKVDLAVFELAAYF